MNLIHKIIIGAVAALMLLLTIAGSVNAYSVYPGTYSVAYPQYSPASPNYYYYGDGSGIPTVAGPYPRYYTGFNDYRGNAGDIYAMDDFNHYDDFVGYRDLDVYYPDRGYVDVLRNPTADITTDLLDPSIRVYNSSSYGYDVHGVIPGNGVYTKHYYHDLPWDLGYDYGFAWFQPVISYINKPVFKKACFSQSICTYNHCTCS